MEGGNSDYATEQCNDDFPGRAYRQLGLESIEPAPDRRDLFGGEFGFRPLSGIDPLALEPRPVFAVGGVNRFNKTTVLIPFGSSVGSAFTADLVYPARPGRSHMQRSPKVYTSFSQEEH